MATMGIVVTIMLLVVGALCTIYSYYYGFGGTADGDREDRAQLLKWAGLTGLIGGTMGALNAAFQYLASLF